jgi:hypothetical protein
MDRKREEEAGHEQAFRSFTNAMYVLCEDIPNTGLKQDIHDPTVPLRLKDVALSPGITGSDGEGSRISCSLIADAIKRLHPVPVAAVFAGDSASYYPEFPSVERLPARKTKYWMFAGITADEGTIEGTYKVHDDIYLNQLGLHASRCSGR